MKDYQLNEIKNVTLIGNAGSGKTTLAEAMLFRGGVISRRGDVLNKNTVSDYNDIEQEQGGSVFSTVLYTEYKGKKINFIDTPGSTGFVGGVVSAMTVTDTVLMLLNAKNSVEVGTEILWRYCEKHKMPAIIALNKLDRENANFEKTIEDAKQHFGNKVVLAQYPINPGVGFNSIIDLIQMKMYKWSAQGGKPEISDIPEEERAKAQKLQSILIEAAAENDESLMELFFENETLTEDEMRKGITVGLINHDILPVFCLSAKNDMGVGRLMEFLCNVAPSPDEMPSPKSKDGTEIKCDPNGPTSLFVFKTSIEQHLGEVNFFKVLSGVVSEGDDLINRKKDGKERLSQIYVVAGKNREKVSKLVAGDIGVAVKLKDTKSNQTLSEKGCDYAAEGINYPAPKHRTAIKALDEADDEKLGESLNRIHDQDPTVVLDYSKELKQLIISGQGEHHLNTVKWHLDNVYKIAIEYVAPKIPYRETITKTAQADYRHKKQSGGAGQFGEVHLVIEPYVEGKPAPTQFKLGEKTQNISVRGEETIDMPWGGKLVFYNCIVGGAIDARFLPAILKGVMEKMEFGPLTGCYARDIRVSVYYGKMHPVDSNEISFKLAGAKAFSEAFKKAGPKIMEPVYDVEILVPSDRMGDVMSDMQGRRAVIQGMSSAKGFEKISTRVPLVEMNNYSTALKSLTNGRATYEMKFAEYAQVPQDIQEKLLKEYADLQVEE